MTDPLDIEIGPPLRIPRAIVAVGVALGSAAATFLTWAAIASILAALVPAGDFGFVLALGLSALTIVLTPAYVTSRQWMDASRRTRVAVVSGWLIVLGAGIVAVGVLGGELSQMTAEDTPGLGLGLLGAAGLIASALVASCFASLVAAVSWAIRRR